MRRAQTRMLVLGMPNRGGKLSWESVPSRICSTKSFEQTGAGSAGSTTDSVYLATGLAWERAADLYEPDSCSASFRIDDPPVRYTLGGPGPGKHVVRCNIPKLYQHQP